MELLPNITILYQIAIFVIVWLGLRYLVFDPMQAVLAERRQRTVEAEHAAEAMVEAARTDRARYDAALHERRTELAREAEAARRAAIEESNRAIADARHAITQELAARRAAVTAQLEQARRALAGEAETIAEEMLQRVRGGAR